MLRWVAGLVSLWITTAQEAPKFETGARLVQINVLARDKGGPVANLTKGDFVITDRGKPQKISVFSVTTDAARRGQDVPARLPENTFSNRAVAAASPNSVTIVLLDGLNTLVTGNTSAYEERPTWADDHALAYAKEHLMDFVKGMDSKDRVAIYSLAESLSVLSDFTNDREQLLRILNGYRASSVTDREKADPRPVHTPVPGDFDALIDHERQELANTINANRAQITMSALASIAAHVAAIPGRKNLVWLTADLPFPAAAIARVVERADIAIYPVDARGLLTRRTIPGTIDDVGGIFGGAKPGAPNSQPRGQDVMQEIAEDTGGRAFINTNDLAQAIRSAVEDAAVTYTLGFYVEPAALDGKFHPVKVHLKQGHADLRYPKGYFAIQDAPAAETKARLADGIKSPLEAAGIHLVARIERVKPDSISISGSVDLHQVELVRSGDVQKGSVEIMIVQQNAAGLVIARENKTVHLDLNRESYAQLLKTGIMFREVVEPKDGLATLRILVADSGTATTGSLIVPISHVK
jgi:VWFA-related protein